MREFTLETKTAAKIHVVEGSECISVYSHKTAYSIGAHYKLDKKHYDQLQAYDSTSKLLKFAKANSLEPDLGCVAPKPIVNHSGEAVIQPRFAYRDGSLLSKEGILVFKGDKVTTPTPESYKDILSNDKGDTLFMTMNLSSFSDNGEVIEIAILDSEEQILLHSLVKHSSYVKWIDKSAIATHGINNSDIKRAPSFARLWPKIKELTADKKLIVNNCNGRNGMVLSYERGFDCLDTRLTFSELFPLNIVVNIMQYYRFCWQEFTFSTVPIGQEINDACDQQSICYDDILDQRAVGEAIKLVRLYHRLHASLPA